MAHSHCTPRTFSHHITCQHQVEIEVWPKNAEVNFRDERYCNPTNTQVRFYATVFNASGCVVDWRVYALDGTPGLGIVDASGEYTAPETGFLTSGYTEVVVATSKDDPMRSAAAYVSVVGFGPEPQPVATISLLPRRASIYYREFYNNSFIDESNTMVMCEAIVHNSTTGIVWKIDNAAAPDATSSRFYCYKAPLSGSDKTVIISADLNGSLSASAQAIITVVNYKWPGVILS
jgi:hypothetical protein